MLGGDGMAGFRGGSDIERRRLAAEGRVLEPGPFHLDMPAAEGDLLAGHQAMPYLQELVGSLVPVGVAQKNAVTPHFMRISAGDDVHEQPARGEPLERSGHAGGDRHRDACRADRHEKTQALRGGHERGCDDPAVLAGMACRHEHAGIAEPVDGLGDLPEIRQVGYFGALRRAQVAPVSHCREVPE